MIKGEFYKERLDSETEKILAGKTYLHFSIVRNIMFEIGITLGFQKHWEPYLHIEFFIWEIRIGWFL